MTLKSLLGAAGMAALVAIPALGSAQYRSDRRQDDRWREPIFDRRYESEIERLVIRAERSSNEFREQFERMWDSRRERDWNRGWDDDWNRWRSRSDVLQRGRGLPGSWYENSRYGQGRRDDRYERDRYDRDQDWDRDYRYDRRYSPKDAVQRLDEGLERLRREVTRNRKDRYAGRAEMMEVVRAADNVDFYFGRGRNYNGRLDRLWSSVRRDVDSLARFYNVRPYDRW